MKINEAKIKTEIITLYSLFIDNPEDKKTIKKAEKMYAKYSGLISFLEHSKEKLISNKIGNALNSIEEISLYGLFEDNHPAFSKEKILKNIRKQLIKLNGK